MRSLTRTDVAELANVSLSQLDYLVKLDVVRPDVGDHRKKFSIKESRLTVIAAEILRVGVSPNAIASPFAKLRQLVTYPDVDLPEELPAIDIEIKAQIFSGSLPKYEHAREDVAKILAAHIYSARDGNVMFSLDHDKITERFQTAIASDESTLRGSAESALREAEYRLLQPRTWTLEQQWAVQRALEFELACRGWKSVYVQVCAPVEIDEWSVLISEQMKPMTDKTSWITIDVQKLFSRKSLI